MSCRLTVIFIDIGGGRVRYVHARVMCNFYAHIQSYDIISEIDVDVSRALVPATVECDVLPSVDVDRSGIEHLDPGQQGELTDESAVYFSKEPVLCRVCGAWLPFIFLVCSMMTLSMTVCLECEIVKFLCLFSTVVVRGTGHLESCVNMSCLLLCAIVYEFTLHNLVSLSMWII